MLKNFAGILILAFAAAAALIPAAYAEDGKPRLAPLNPAFVQYLEALKLHGAAKTLKTPSGHGLGKIPSPVIAIAGSPAATASNSGVKVSYPASYDLRDHNRVTPVKDQGSCGDCWAFSAMGSMESYFRPGETLDLSEADLDANSGFDIGSCNGGYNQMSAAYMARWSGPLVEGSSTVVKHAQNIIFLTARAGAADNDRIKSALLAYGGLGVSFYYDSSYYKSGTHSFYANISTGAYSSNHEVTLIGWDDNYPGTNFSVTPGGDGAFICKNSWGTGWGDNGYFYVSYYDGIFGRDDYTVAFTGEAVTGYTREYGYDKLGWVTDLGYNSTTAWYSNIFTAAADEWLKAVGFYTNDSSTSYTIYIYSGVTAGQPASGTLAYSASGSFNSPGYYTVPVGDLAVARGQLFSAVVKVTNASNTFPIPVEALFTGYSSGASSSGQSYTGSDGASWTALTGISSGQPTNVTLKAYATSRPPAGTVALKDNLFRPLKNPAVKCKIAVTVFSGGNVTIKVYTLNGGFVKTVYSGPQNIGSFNYSWDGKNENGAVVASGLYLVHIKGPNTDKTEKVVVIK
ncbi:MAG: lectin like domain-containing protein [Elusimicrobia bacterium]|nr:lectin like domain-containing protein [Elusimicrobiota bacterium]